MVFVRHFSYLSKLFLLDLSFWKDEYTIPSAQTLTKNGPTCALILGFGLMTLRFAQVYYRWFKYDEPILTRVTTRSCHMHELLMDFIFDLSEGSASSYHVWKHGV